MGYKIHAYLLAAVMLFTAGCSSNPASLDRAALKQNKIAAIDLRSSQKLGFEPSNRGSTTGGAFGLAGSLIGAGVDAAVNANRAKVLGPVLASMGNYDVREVFAKKLKAMRGDSFAPAITVHATAEPKESATNVLNVVSSYAIQPNHQSVKVSATTAIKPTKESAVYKRGFSAISNIDTGNLGDKKINVTQYLIANPSKLKGAIESAMDKVVMQIAHDINSGKTDKTY